METKLCISGSYKCQGMSRLFPKLGGEPGSKYKHLTPSHPQCLTITSLTQTAAVNSLKNKS